MKVLYTQHTSVLGGSSRSLYELISNLPSDVQPTVLSPKGDFSNFLEEKGISTIYVKGIPQFDNTRVGYYRKFRWLILLREFFYLPFFIKIILQCKKEKFDIVHINEITQLYTIVFAKMVSKKVVLHVRSVQMVSNSLRNLLIEKIILKYVDVVIPIDKTVEQSLPSSYTSIVVHNGISLKNVVLSKKNQKFTVGIVSNFQRYKGILEFIDAANICLNRYKLDIDFVVYGASYSNSISFKDKLLDLFGFRENLQKIIEEKIKNYNFSSNFNLKGYVDNHNDIYNFIDILIFPSHLNAVGRPVFEASFYKIPSIVAVENPLDDTIIEDITGLTMNAKDSESLAQKIKYLYLNQNKIKIMGNNAFTLANKNFNSEKNSIKIYNIYKKIK